MYAALVVSMWSKSEYLLKTMIKSSCHNINITNEVKGFHKIAKIVEFFKEKLEIELKLLPSYHELNAVRVLCNSFKHSDGRYDLNPAYETDNIEEQLFDWRVVNRQYVNEEHKKREKDSEYKEKPIKIEYTKLPLEVLVCSCYRFFYELVNKIESKLLEKIEDGCQGQG